MINKYFKGVLNITQTYIKFKESSTEKAVNNANTSNIYAKQGVKLIKTYLFNFINKITSIFELHF